MSEPISDKSQVMDSSDNGDSFEENLELMQKFINEVKDNGTDDVNEHIKLIVNDVKVKLGNLNINVDKTKTEIKPEKDIKCKTSGIIESSSDSCSDERKVRRKVKKRRVRKIEQSSSDSDIKRKPKHKNRYRNESREDKFDKLLGRLDARELPDIDAFDESKHGSLIKYFDRFEKHCEDKFKARTYVWINELERKLSDRVLEAFQSLYQEDDRYRDIKEKLIKWYEEEQDVRKAKNRKKFDQAKRCAGESWLAYSSRLEKLFRVAYPNKITEQSMTLVTQFKNTVCSPLRDIIRDQIRKWNLKGRKPDWKIVQKCARLYDIEEVEEVGTDKPNQKEIIINLNKTNLGLGEEYANKTGNEYSERTHNNNGCRNTDYGYKHNNDQNEGNSYRKKRNNYDDVGRPPLHQSYKPKYERKLNNVGLNDAYNHRKVVCQLCNKVGHSAQYCWSSQRKRCHICGKSNHIARDCYYNKQRQSSNRTLIIVKAEASYFLQ